MTSTGLDQRTLGALVANARAAMTEYDDALAWLEVAVKGPMEPVAAEVWAFDESFTRVLLVRHRWRGWVPPGGRVEAGETPREAARREFREETGLGGRLLEAPAAVTADLPGGLDAHARPVVRGRPGRISLPGRGEPPARRVDPAVI